MNNLRINYTDYDSLIERARDRIYESIEGIPSAKQMNQNRSNLLIVSDGAPMNTKVYVRGQELSNITSILIDGLDVKSRLVSATITVLLPALHVRAEKLAP